MELLLPWPTLLATALAISSRSIVPNIVPDTPLRKVSKSNGVWTTLTCNKDDLPTRFDLQENNNANRAEDWNITTSMIDRTCRASLPPCAYAVENKIEGCSLPFGTNTQYRMHNGAWEASDELELFSLKLGFIVDASNAKSPTVYWSREDCVYYFSLLIGKPEPHGCQPHLGTLRIESGYLQGVEFVVYYKDEYWQNYTKRYGGASERLVVPGVWTVNLAVVGIFVTFCLVGLGGI